jgi:type IV secretion system protein VirB10
MAGLALGMLAIIFIAGRPESPAGQPTPPALAQQPPNPERLREYQERLRILDERAAQDVVPEAAPSAPPPVVVDGTVRPAPEDPLVTERRRRDYESLFAANVAWSRRPDGERNTAEPPARPRSQPLSDSNAPSIDDIADAVVRATARVNGTAAPQGSPVPSTAPVHERTVPASVDPSESLAADRPGHYHLMEGTVIDTVLTNRLDGSMAAPLNCLVTNPVYSSDRRYLLIPSGARVLGQTKPVQSLGEARLAVAFHRLVMPDGSSHRLDEFIGVNQIGDAGLRDRVNHHYWSTFGAAGAVGLITGFSQLIGSLGFGGGDGERTLIVAGSTSDATAQASLQVMNRFLNRMPTITIREGHRVKVYLTSDLQLPAYEGPTPKLF